MRKKLLACFVVATAMLAAGVAWASWLANGTGTGAAKAITATALTVTPGSPGAQLYPGGTGDVLLTINNTNPYPVRITAINGNGAITSDKGTNCNASTGVTYTNQTGTYDVAANSSANFTLVGAVAMSNASHNDCQGAVFTIPVSVSGASNA